jgi:hypothetical protein
LPLQGGDVDGEILFGAPHSSQGYATTHSPCIDNFKQFRTNGGEAVLEINEALSTQIGDRGL